MPGTITDSVRLSNGVAMPWLGLGTWQAKDGDEVERAVRAALDLGYRHIDTAMIYGNERGVGRAVRDSRVPRDQVFVTTKLWNDDARKGYDACLKAFDASLDRLGLDYIDLYLVHWPVKGHYRDAWRALETIYGDGRGKARAVGVSNFMIPHLEDVLRDARVVPMVNQVEFHPRLLQRELLEFCKRLGIVEEAWSPLMQGRVGQIPELKRIADQHGRTPAQIALRWNLEHGVVTIPKSVKRERIAENAALFDFALTPDEMRAIDALDRGERTGADPNNFNF